MFLFNFLLDLTIQTSPSKDIYARKYNVVYFVCKVDGPEKVTVTWKYNGKPVTRPPPYPMPWSQGGVLMIRPLFVGRSDGYYECVASDSRTTLNRGFNLTVKEEKDLPAGFPKITTQPRSIFLTEGETAQFRCRAEGNPTPKLKWFLSRKPLNVSMPRISILPDDTLQVSQVSRQDGGLFECEASNSVGYIISYKVGIFAKPKKVIKIKPTLLTRQKDVTVDPESRVTLSCTATGKPQPVFSWYKNGLLYGGGTNGHLHLSYILESNNFTCRARNGAGYEESTCRLTVRPKPLTPTEPKLVKENASSITITWRKNYLEDDEITGYIVKYRSKGTQKWKNTSLVAPVTPTARFTLNGLKPYTFWEFQVIAFNHAGNSLPSKINYFASGETLPETPAWNLLGKGVSDTSFNATWKEPLIPNGRIRRYRVYYTVDKNDPLSDWSLEYAGNTYKIIRRTQRRTVYYFKIQVVGTAGLGPMSETAIVKSQGGDLCVGNISVPGQPFNVSAVPQSSKSIQVSWKNPVYKGNGLDGYEVQYNSKRGSLKKESEFGVTQNLLQGLHPYTNYTINVLAKSFGGLGPPSEPIHCMTLQDAPSGPPQGSKARPRSSTSIEVFWNPPLPHLRNGLITGYNIMYTPVRGSVPSILSVDGSKRNAMLTGLRKYTKYTIWVSSKTAVGEGPPSNKFELFTDEDVPEGAPRDIRAYAINDSAISVTWNEPIEKSGRIRGYFVYYLPVKDNHEIIKGKTLPHSYDAVGSQQRHVILMSKVEPSTTYQIRVAAYTLKGDGTRSSEVYVKTPKRLPAAPEIRWANLRGPKRTDLSLAWRPNYPGVLQYKIEYGKALTKFDNLADVRTKYVNVRHRSHVFKGLSNGVWYLFKVSAQTLKDWSIEARKWVKMPDGIPGEAPQNIRAITESSTSIKITWESPDPWLRHGRITKYIISYKMTANGEPRSKRFKVNDDSARLEMIINNLQVKTEYSFTLTAYTSAGAGPASIAVTSRTDDQTLPFVRSVSVSEISSNSVLVKWIPPKFTPGFTVTGYKVTASGSKSYKDASGVEKTVRSNEEKQIPSKLNSAYFNNLKPNLYYTISVWILTTSGTGQRKVSQFWTKKTAPPAVDPPRNVKYIGGTKVSLIISPSPTVNGDVEFYHIYVVDYGLNYQQSNDLRSKNPDSLFKNQQKRSRRSSPRPVTYVTAELLPSELPKEVIIGEGNKIGDYKNKKLTPGHTYQFFSRAYVKQDSEYVYKSSNLTRPITIDLQPTDKTIGNKDNKSGKTGSQNNTPQKKSGGSGVMIAGIVVSLVLVIIIVLLAIYFRRRGCRKPSLPGDEEARKPLRRKNGSLAKDEKPKDLVELHRLKFPTTEMKTHPPIPVDEFAHHVMDLKADDAEKIVQEFESFDPGQSHISEASNQPCNKVKNRYPNLQAYDHTRVVLQFTGEVGSDYLNANYIDGYCQEKAFIATQGPMTNTVADFWRACWENKTGTIVMMTKLEERGRGKCEQYWPNSGITTYGNIRVSKVEQVELANYVKRTFEICSNDREETRIVKQFQFTAWPDLGVPRNPAALLSFTERVRKENVENAGPIIVHCSAGVGRTGCFIVIYSMLERIKNEQTVDIYGYVTMLRSQRNFMVQNDEQYIFVHDAILDAIQSGSTAVPANELSIYLKTMSEFNKKHGDVLIERDFNVIVCATVPNKEDCMSASAEMNQSKNRLASILPFDSNRVCLEQLRGQEETDYINASHIDGYRGHGEFIAAQGPTKETVEDFWRMIMEQGCSIIVMLTNLTDRGKEMCYQYWPSEKAEKYHYYIVEPVTETREANFFIRKFKITDARDGDTRTITQFQYINFHKGEVPVSPEGIIQLIGHVNRLKNQDSNPGPILCHSNSGVGRTGVFIALNIIFERLQAEDVIDIHQTVKTLRFERAFMVQNLQQYIFCFEAAESFLRSFELSV
eukprot:gene7839-8688_t